MAWAVKYAGAVLNRCEVGHDGRTAYERLKGKKVRIPGLEFAEGVLWKLDNRTGALGELLKLLEVRDLHLCDGQVRGAHRGRCYRDLEGQVGDVEAS